MTPLPTIYTIHASDAPQHTRKLHEILQKLKAENRISDFIVLNIDNDLSPLDTIEDDDLTLTLLTSELEPRKEEIQSRLRALKVTRPNVKIAEIIVDKVTYDNEFITFPTDLKPIRDREDMDVVWSNIEQSLKDIFPISIIEHKTDPPTDWKKYVKYGIAVLVLGLLIWLVPKILQGEKPEVAFQYKVFNPVSDEFYSDTTECFAPCIVYFDNESRNYDSLIWDFGDTVSAGETDPKYLFLNPGEKKIVLTASLGNKKNNFSKTLLVKAPPYADFEIDNNGCIAPCSVTFTNKSENAENFVWEFGDASEQSSENAPSKEYANPGEYQVRLTVTNQIGMKDDTVKTLTIREDDSPFAQFTIRKNGQIRTVPRNITFTNSSKNADQYIWNFGDGSNAVTTSNSPHVDHTYLNPGNYTVVLTAKKDNQESTTASEFYIGPDENRFGSIFEIPKEYVRTINEDPQLKRQLQSSDIRYRTN